MMLVFLEIVATAPPYPLNEVLFTNIEFKIV